MRGENVRLKIGNRIDDCPKFVGRRFEHHPHTAAEFAVLGPLRVVRDGVDNTPTAPKLRQVLGLLLLRRGQLVRTSDLIEELWGEAPSGSAVSTLQTYIHQIRKLLAEDPSPTTGPSCTPPSPATCSR